MAEMETKNKRINSFIKKTVIETIQEILEDPDFGLELQEWVKKRLKKKPKKLIPLEEIKKKYL
jgi:uncharacterized protein YpbB